ncbi:hypothetical protein ACQPXB_08600 [Amycolatopsis sp. CA-161197]|uniref:hypothetical protein n=1 Tax=Amycolatopsis sp. CA-161197 TaxID=3239922 RepID=UPI003D8AADCE
MAILRQHWEELPRPVHRAVEALLGPIQAATTVGPGQNSAIAAVLETTQRTVFVKGLRTDQRAVVTQQREASINPHVRPVSPELLWRLEIHGWDLLCFEHLNGRPADYTPGSPDLPPLIDTMRRLAALPCPNLPPAYFRPAQLRWAELIDDPDARQQLAGDTILHTDYNPSNIIVTTTGELKMIDWAWPTRGAAWIDPACLVPRLIAWGHTPAGAEDVAAQCPAWNDADPAAIDLFVNVLTTMWDSIAQDQPGEDWKQTLATSAKQWLEYRATPATA